MKNKEFYRLLHNRELTTTTLAELVGTSRPHLTEVLNNTPGHGHVTRRKVFPWILPEEASALGWREDYDAWLRGPAQAMETPERRRGSAALPAMG